MPAINPATNEEIAQNKEITNSQPIYFSMNVPDWFMNIPDTKEKCKIIENLVNDLENEGPITQKQREELINIE